MTQRAFFLWMSILVIPIGLQACATRSPDAPAPNASNAPGWTTTSDLVFQYRQQAAELREMARRLEFEAEMYAQLQEQQQAQRKRELARDMRAAADTADEQAREYRRQLPHNQVY